MLCQPGSHSVAEMLGELTWRALSTEPGTVATRIIPIFGLLHHYSTAGGHMIISELCCISRVDSADLFVVEDSTDFELYSSRSSGAMQGYGYQFHEQGTYGYDSKSKFLHI